MSFVGHLCISRLKWCLKMNTHIKPIFGQLAQYCFIWSIRVHHLLEILLLNLGTISAQATTNSKKKRQKRSQWKAFHSFVVVYNMMNHKGLTLRNSLIIRILIRLLIIRLSWGFNILDNCFRMNNKPTKKTLKESKMSNLTQKTKN